MAQRALELLALVARFWFILLILLLVYSAFKLTWRDLRRQRKLGRELADAKRMGHLRYTGKNLKGLQRGQEWVFLRESIAGSASGCDIVLPHPSILRYHARLFAIEGYLSCEPAPGAACYANGEEFFERTALMDGDELTLGDLRFRVELYDEPLEDTAPPPRKRRRRKAAPQKKYEEEYDEDYEEEEEEE